MVEPGVTNNGRKVNIAEIKICISADSGHASLTCVLPHIAVGSVKSICVPGITEVITFRKIIAEILIQKIFVAVKHGEVSFLLNAIAETLHQLFCQIGGNRDSFS